MFIKITENMFIDAFHNKGRGNQFSHGALCALFNYMEETEDNCGQEVGLDVIALCCEFTEYADLHEYNQDYIKEGNKAETMEDIEDRTTVIYTGNGFSFLVLNY